MSFSALRTIAAPLRRTSLLTASARGGRPCDRCASKLRHDVLQHRHRRPHDDQLELRDAVSSFAAAELAPEKAAQIDRDNASPKDIWTKLGDMGLLGITVPEEFGGFGQGVSRPYDCYGGTFAC